MDDVIFKLDLNLRLIRLHAFPAGFISRFSSCRMLLVWRIHLQRRLAPVYAISGFAASKSDEDAALALSAPAERGRSSGASTPAQRIAAKPWKETQ